MPLPFDEIPRRKKVRASEIEGKNLSLLCRENSSVSSGEDLATISWEGNFIKTPFEIRKSAGVEFLASCQIHNTRIKIELSPAEI